MQSLLNKGIGFCPTPKNVNTTQLLADFNRMERSMAWHFVFKNSDNNNDKTVNENGDFIFEKEIKTNLPKNIPKKYRSLLMLYDQI